MAKETAAPRKSRSLASARKHIMRVLRQVKLLVDDLVDERDLILKGLTYQLNPKRQHRCPKRAKTPADRRAWKEAEHRTLVALNQVKGADAVIRSTVSEIRDAVETIESRKELIRRNRIALPDRIRQAEQSIDHLKCALDAQRRCAHYNDETSDSKRPSRGSGSPRSRRSDTMTAKQKKDETTKLLGDLEKSADQTDKRKIRAKLRGLGHKGGLGKKATPKKSATASKGKGKKGKGKGGKSKKGKRAKK